jgi:hypothetical protein
MHAFLRLFCVIQLVFIASCSGDGTDSSTQPDTSTESDAVASDAAGESDAQDTEEEVAVPDPLHAWPEQVISVSTQLDEQTFEGDIATGAALSMAWADEPGVDCWTLIHAAKFTGNQLYYGLSEGLTKSKTLEFTLTPAEGVDLNLVAYGVAIGTYYFPPDVPEVQACLSSMGGGAGEPETLNLNNLTEPLVWLVGVAAPEGQTSGAFTLVVTRHQN